MRAWFLFLIVCSLYLVSCQNSGDKPNADGQSNTRAAIFLSAGDIYPKFNIHKIPTFFNIGKILTDQESNLEAIILSERLKKGSRVYILPLGVLSFEMNNSTHRFIVSVPVGEQYTSLGSNYNDFIISNITLQSNIENWFAAQCPKNRGRNFTWQNSYKALLDISNYNK